MRRWLMLVALALLVGGCQSAPQPTEEKQQEPPRIEVPNGEASPFGS